MIEDWKQYIYQDPEWCTGAAILTTNGETIMNYEKKECQIIYENPIGLAYLSDFYFAYNDGKGTQNCNEDPYCKSWMTVDALWTMTRYNASTAWGMSNLGLIMRRYQDQAGAACPVFYLESKVVLIGNGQKQDPFIIDGIAK